MNKFYEESLVLHSPFDMETHKRTFINYLEIVIHEDGLIEYAIPSHSEKMIAIACDKLNVSRDELNAMVPVEYYFDMNKWLSQTSGCIAVRDFGYEGIANDEQLQSLIELAEYGLYKGVDQLQDAIVLNEFHARKAKVDGFDTVDIPIDPSVVLSEDEKYISRKNRK